METIKNFVPLMGNIEFGDLDAREFYTSEFKMIMPRINEELKEKLPFECW